MVDLASVGTILVFLLMGAAVDLIRRKWKFLEFPPVQHVAEPSLDSQ